MIDVTLWDWVVCGLGFLNGLAVGWSLRRG
jgi:hypothetical protein